MLTRRKNDCAEQRTGRKEKGDGNRDGDDGAIKERKTEGCYLGSGLKGF